MAAVGKYLLLLGLVMITGEPLVLGKETLVWIFVKNMPTAGVVS
jgi:hypothetical protein